MRHLSAATLIAIAILTAPAIFGQTGGQNLSVGNFQLVSREKATQTQDFVVYRADLINSGQAVGNVAATASTQDPYSVRTVPGQDVLNFVRVLANGRATSVNTIKFLVTSGTQLDFNKLVWTFQITAAGPIADPGPNQIVKVGTTAILNGSGSTNPSGIGTLTYRWEMPGRPSGTSARITNGSSPIASFFVDVAGEYLLQLTVSNGVVSDTASTIVSTTTTPAPVANAGSNQTVNVGANVVLNGAASTSGSGNPLTYSWTLTNRPSGSTAALAGANTVAPTFTVDKNGSYQAQLIVTDGVQTSAPSNVIVSTQNVKPVAKAGGNQLVSLGTVVQLDGSGSTDANGLPLTYLWSVNSLPDGSTASLSNSTAVTPTFTADKAGIYVAQLIVSNGSLSSDPSTVTITLNPGQAPVANAGVNQTVQRNSTVQLNGSGTDPQALPLTFKWSFNSKPAGSNAALSSTTVANPTFVADQSGNYVLQLVVNNGNLNSPASTVTISTTCAPPTANAGSAQTVTAGSTVFLTGQASGDVCSSPFTYSWTLTTVPAASTASLSGASTVSPTFVADIAGIYVAQLIVNNGVTNSTPATVTITASPVTSSNSFSFNPTSVSICGNGTQSLTVKLASPAGAGGVTVNLSSDNTAVATVPSAMFIPANATSTTFSVTGVGAGSAKIHASASNIPEATAAVTVTSCAGIILPTNVSLTLNESTAFPVALSSPAPAGGVFVSLSSSDTSVVSITPVSLLINEGRTTPNRAPNLNALAYGSATITATAFGFPTATQKVVVSAGTLSFNPPSLTITGAITQNLTLSISAPLASSVAINLSSNDPSVASVPATVNLPAGALSTTVPVTGLKQGTTAIHASSSALADVTASVTVNIAGQVTLPAGVSVGLGQSAPFPVTLTSGAGAGGLTVTLTGDSKVSISPSTVFIAAGSTTPATQPQVTGIGLGTGTIGASAPNSSPASQTVQVTGSISFAGGIGVTPGGSGNLTLTLSGPAPAGGFAVNLSSSNPGVVTVAPTVTIPAGSTNAQVAVTGVATGSATITASGSGVANATATVSVNPGSITLPANTTLALGQSTTFAVTLSAPVTSAVTISLTSGDTTRLTVPATVVIPQGSTTPVTQPQITAIGAGLTSVSASATGYGSTTQPVLVSAAMSFSGPLSIPAGSSGNLTLNLTTGQAPAGGLAINLSSGNTTFATVPSSVNIPAGATTVTVPVTGVAPGNATITASATNIANATAIVTVGSPGTLLLAPSTPVGLGQSVAFPVSISTPAISALTVTLISNDTSKVTISPGSVVIPQGSTTPASQPQVTGVGAGTATVTASAPAYAPVTAPVLVTAPTLSFASNTLNIGANGTGTLTLNLSSAAPPAGLNINLSSSNTGAATVPSTVNFPANATSATFTVTGVAAGTTVIHASAPSIADTTATVTVNPPLTVLLQSGVSVGLGKTATIAVTLSSPAASNVTVNLASSDSSKVSISPSSVSIAQGQTAPASQPQVTGVSGGSANISATASGFTSATQAVSVTTPTLSFPGGTLAVTAGGTANLVLTLSTTAPAGGLTINLSSSNTSAATVPSTVSFAANASTANVTVTGVGVGSAVIHASALPNIPDVSANVTVSAPPSILLPANFSVPVGLSATFNVTLSSPAVSSVTVNLNSTDSGKVGISPGSVVIPAGATSPTTQPQVTGVSAGSAQINASASGFTSASATVQAVTTSAVFSPSELPIHLVAPVIAGAKPDPVQQNLILSLSQPAPAGGANINLSSSAPGVAAVPATVTFPAGTAFAVVPVTGKAAGTVTITASGPGLNTTATVTVTALCDICINVGNAAVGNNLQSLITVTLPKPAPAGPDGKGVSVFLNSSDGGKLLLSGKLNLVGQSFSSVFMPVGSNSINIFIQGLASSGTVIISASSPESGFTDGSGIVTLTPSGFIVAGPNGAGQPFSIGQGGSTTLTIQPARLDSFGNVIEVQPVRGTDVGKVAGPATSVTLTVSPSALGTVTLSCTKNCPITDEVPDVAVFKGGEDTKTKRFIGGTPGVGTITASQPAGFTAPSQGAGSLPVTISSAALQGTPATVGRGLEATSKVLLTTPSPFIQVVITTDDASKLLLSDTKDGPGVPSITLLVPPGFTNTQDFYVYGLASSGTVTYTATANGYASGQGIVTLAPSGIVIVGPGGIGSDKFTTTTQLGTTPISATTVLLDQALNYLAKQAVAGGTSVNATLSSSLQSVGSFNPSVVTIAGGTDTGTTAFQPAGAGTTTLSVNVPTGFSQSNLYRTIAATVATPSIFVTDNVTIGNKLQATGTLILPGSSPNPVSVTLTSNNPSQLLLSNSASGAGVSSITVTVPQGSTFGSFYLQGFAASGQATYTASVPGYQSRTATVKFAPSFLVISGQPGFDLVGQRSRDVNARVSQRFDLTVAVGIFDPVAGNFVNLALAGGQTLNLTVANTDDNVATISASSPQSPTPQITGGNDSTSLGGLAWKAGVTTVSLPTVPAGFTPNTFSSVTVIVQ